MAKKKIDKKKFSYWYDLAQNNKKVLSVIFAAIILISAMTLAYSIRAQTWDLPAIEEQAKSQVDSFYLGQIREQLAGQNPSLSQSDLDNLARERFDAYISENNENYLSDLNSVVEQFKSNYKDDDGNTYLAGIDPYYYWQLTRQYQETGYLYDTVLEDGSFVDSYQLAPVGRSTAREEMHPKYSTWMYNFLSFFNLSLTPYWVFYMMPALVGMLTIIPAFFLGRLFGGNFGGGIAAFVMAVHPSFVGRSVGGFSSTDSYNLLFPLVIVWLIVEAFYAKNQALRGFLASLGGFFIGLFSITWSAWTAIMMLIFIILMGYFGFTVVSHLINKTVHTKNSLLKSTEIVGAYLVSSAVFISIFRSFSDFLGFIPRALGRSSLQSSIGSGLWPNVLTTVAELNRPSVEQIINNTGGPLLFALAFVGLLMTLLPLKNWKPSDHALFWGGVASVTLAMGDVSTNLASSLGVDYSITFTLLLMAPFVAGFVMRLFDDRDFNIAMAMAISVWFVVMSYTSTQGMRFLLLLVPAFAIALGISLGRIMEFLLAKAKDSGLGEPKVATVSTYILVLVGAVFLLAPLSQAGNDAAFGRVPSMNDGWYDVLVEIKEETSEDAIITSWWDFGHWFKSVADRSVTFDGGTQNTPMAYWTGRAFSARSEDDAIAIFRMLNCGSREGFNELYDAVSSETSIGSSDRTFFEAKSLLDDALDEKDYDLAVETYAEVIGQDKARNVADLTHCDAPQSLFIASGDMVGKAAVWGHFGGWSFERALIVSDYRDRPVSEATKLISGLMDVDEGAARDLYFEARSLSGQRETNNWISVYPQFYSGQSFDCEVNETRFSCDIGIGVDQTQSSSVILASFDGDLDNLSNSTFRVDNRNRNGVTLRSQRSAPAIVSLNGEMVEVEGSGFNVEAALFEDDEGLTLVLGDSQVASGLFSKLFFTQNSDYFNLLFDSSTSMSEDKDIFVFEVDYDRWLND